LMCLQAGLPLALVGRIAIQDAIVTDDAAIHFVEPDFMDYVLSPQLLEKKPRLFWTRACFRYR
jgi:hypothetical protein